MKPEEQLLELVSSGNPVKEAEVEALFNKLQPVDGEFLVRNGGAWGPGPDIETGHPIAPTIKSGNFAGKDFVSLDHVKPAMHINEKGERVNNDEAGFAVLRRVEFRGVVSMAVIYDKMPIIDYFRYVNDDLVVGAMENKLMPTEQCGTFYFLLKRST